MLHDAVDLVESGPVLIRYPRGQSRSVGEHEVGEGLKARRVRTGDGSICVLAIGKLVAGAERAVETLAAEGIDATLWDVRCCAPLDPEMIADAAAHGAVLTMEDGVREGGVGMSIADLVEHACTREVRPRVEVLGVPTRFVPHAKPERILAQLGLDADGIARAIRSSLGR